MIYARAIFFALSMTLVGCSGTPRIKNQPVSIADTVNTTKADMFRPQKNLGDTMLLLGFSGGGTRAAAFSYGVLTALRDTEVNTSSGPKGCWMKLMV